MIAMFAAMLLQPDVPPLMPPAPPPPPPLPEIALANAYSVTCRIEAMDGPPFEVGGRVSGRGGKRAMRVSSGAPDRFPSGTAEAGKVYRSDVQRYRESFFLKRKLLGYSILLWWDSGRIEYSSVSRHSLDPRRPEAPQRLAESSCRLRE
jgi:hypothetical protein